MGVGASVCIYRSESSAGRRRNEEGATITKRYSCSSLPFLVKNNGPVISSEMKILLIKEKALKDDVSRQNHLLRPSEGLKAHKETVVCLQHRRSVCSHNTSTFSLCRQTHSDCPPWGNRTGPAGSKHRPERKYWTPGRKPERVRRPRRPRQTRTKRLPRCSEPKPNRPVVQGAAPRCAFGARVCALET